MHTSQLVTSSHLSIIVGVAAGCSLDCIYCFKGFTNSKIPALVFVSAKPTVAETKTIPTRINSCLYSYPN